MNKYLYLTQTDTTLGFVSQDAPKIDKAKKRLPNKHYIRTVDSFKTLKSFTRIPTQHKNLVRRAKRTTFIINKESYRVIRGTQHNLLLDRVGWLYSSSANLSGAEYDEVYAKEMTEVVVSFPKRAEGRASTIYKLGKLKSLKKIR